MIEEKITMEEFYKHVYSIRVLNLFRRKMFKNSRKLAIAKLSTVGEVTAYEFDEVGDFSSYWFYNLPWHYVKNKSVGWHVPSARNYTISKYTRKRNKRVTKILNSLKRGLRKDINIIVLYDESIGEFLIVDGSHRAVALYRLYQSSKASARRLIESKYRIRIIEFASPVAACFCPLDFMNVR